MQHHEQNRVTLKKIVIGLSDGIHSTDKESYGTSKENDPANGVISKCFQQSCHQILGCRFISCLDIHFQIQEMKQLPLCLIWRISSKLSCHESDKGSVRDRRKSIGAEEFLFRLSNDFDIVGEDGDLQEERLIQLTMIQYRQPQSRPAPRHLLFETSKYENSPSSLI